ncbi:DNA translocase FtsK [Paraburkholderia unamae]|uniref:FtsK-like protein n=1 Tax=Paraburkholderia unamae TaxID=219649 RepID=A0ABX5KUC8_9BURK|nr:DNA translocase FtsK [Paraburkholderia unamae]PVX86445.1 FtsK-like protein [Paraburkholderia unamae]
MNAPQGRGGSSDGTAPFDVDDDPLYGKAVSLVATNNRASVSFIQRHLQIGYTRAIALVGRMEQEGLVSPMNSVGHRSILPKIHGYSIAGNVTRASSSNSMGSNEAKSDDGQFDFMAGLEIYRETIANISNIACTAAALPNGAKLTPEQAIAFRDRHWHVLWRAILDIIAVCDENPQAVLDAIKGGGSHAE